VFELAAHGARGAGYGKSFFYLAENLRLSHHHRIQAGGHAEEMPHGLLVLMLIEVRSQKRRVKPEVPV